MFPFSSPAKRGFGALPEAPFFPTYRRGHYPQPPSIPPLKSPRPFPNSPGRQVETLFEATGEIGGREPALAAFWEWRAPDTSSS